MVQEQGKTECGWVGGTEKVSEWMVYQVEMENLSVEVTTITFVTAFTTSGSPCAATGAAVAATESATLSERLKY